jgi:hypothetical protein
MKMDKTNRSDLHRLFLFENLPEPLSRASSHLQIFDNYIRDTRIRLRSIRVPETKEWTWVLQQRFPEHEGDLMCWKIAEIYLNETYSSALAVERSVKTAIFTNMTANNSLSIYFSGPYGD